MPPQPHSSLLPTVSTNITTCEVSVTLAPLNVGY